MSEANHNGVQAVTDFEGKTEFWSFGYLGDSLRSYKIWSYQEKRLFSEYYVEQNGKVKEMIIHFQKRKKQSEQIKEIYNP